MVEPGGRLERNIRRSAGLYEANQVRRRRDQVRAGPAGPNLGPPFRDSHSRDSIARISSDRQLEIDSDSFGNQIPGRADFLRLRNIHFDGIDNGIG